MPIYEYECQECGSRMELLQRMGDPAPSSCTACGTAGITSGTSGWNPTPMRRVVSQSTFQLKGSGWYKDGYASTKAGSGGSDG